MIVTLDDYAALECPGYLDPQFDWTTCINKASNAAGAGGTLLFTRGKTYRFGGTIFTSDPEEDPLDDVTWEATGTGARPILDAATIDIYAVVISGHNITFRNLDLRGPHYGQTPANSSRGKVKLCTHYGIIVHPVDGFRLYDCSVNGFDDHGVQTSGSNDVHIEGCQINCNAGSGVAIFALTPPTPRTPPTLIRIIGNDLSMNGENGIDSEACDIVVAGNVANTNGWNFPADVDCDEDYDLVGEGQGLLFQARELIGPITALVVTGNTCSNNRRNGIQLDGRGNNGFVDARLCSNTVQGNGTEMSSHCVGYGIRLGRNLDVQQLCPPSEDVPMSDVYLVENVGGGNYDDDWNTPYPGVTEESHPPHTDEPHQDQHTDIHTDTVTPHHDAHSDFHGDTGCDDPHQDIHSDQHDDAHGDEPGHLDHGDVPHFDWHTDFSGLTDEWNPEHCDATLLVGEPCHSDSHSDTPHGDSHGDSSHSDWHTDGHSDSHEDVAHCDEPHDDWHNDLHSDIDSGHIDSHEDSHADKVHEDVHGDACAPA
jgi:hypothetical protein